MLGCITATIIGVIVGVLRLSTNWIVARLASIYVEIFRNVPVLLWILAIMAIITEMMPAPTAFRGDDPTASMLFADSLAITNRGVYIPWPVWGPGWQVVVGAFLASLVAIWLFGRYARAPAGGDRRHPARPSGSSSRLFFMPDPARRLRDGRPDHPRLSRAPAASTSRAAASSTRR